MGIGKRRAFSSGFSGSGRQWLYGSSLPRSLPHSLTLLTRLLLVKEERKGELGGDARRELEERRGGLGGGYPRDLKVGSNTLSSLLSSFHSFLYLR